MSAGCSLSLSHLSSLSLSLSLSLSSLSLFSLFHSLSLSPVSLFSVSRSLSLSFSFSSLISFSLWLFFPKNRKLGFIELFFAFANIAKLAAKSMWVLLGWCVSATVAKKFSKLEIPPRTTESDVQGTHTGPPCLTNDRVIELCGLKLSPQSQRRSEHIRQKHQTYINSGTERNPEKTANPMCAICRTSQNYPQSLALLSGFRSVLAFTFGA